MRLRHEPRRVDRAMTLDELTAFVADAHTDGYPGDCLVSVRVNGKRVREISLHDRDRAPKRGIRR